MSLANTPGYQGLNTIRQLTGYSQLFSIYVSASKNGCFNYSDQKNNMLYFDISTSRPFNDEGEGDGN